MSLWLFNNFFGYFYVIKMDIMNLQLFDFFYVSVILFYVSAIEVVLMESQNVELFWQMK